jgi:hypothetical protein
VPKKGVLRIFGPKKDKVIGGWRKLHNESCNLYSSPSIIRMIKEDYMSRVCSTCGGKRGRHIGIWWESQKDVDH